MGAEITPSHFVQSTMRYCTTFIDYSTTVSPKFLDKTLKAAKESNKCRTIFRAVYDITTTRTKINNTDGK